LLSNCLKSPIRLDRKIIDITELLNESNWNRAYINMDNINIDLAEIAYNKIII